MTAIEVAGLTKRFGGTLAVDDLSFTVEPGRIVGFLGPNGAGKTTTLRIALGLVSPSAGTATVEGRAYARSTTRSARSARCSTAACSIPAARAATTCARSPARPVSATPAWTTCWSSSR